MDAMRMMQENDDATMSVMTEIDQELLQACLDACAACEQACTVCSTMEMSCAPACMNCADMCHTMMRSMLRMQGMTPTTLMAMLDACIAICRSCMDECAAHASHSAVCAMCAESCRACMDACMALRESLQTA